MLKVYLGMIWCFVFSFEPEECWDNHSTSTPYHQDENFHVLHLTGENIHLVDSLTGYQQAIKKLQTVKNVDRIPTGLKDNQICGLIMEQQFICISLF